MHAAGSTGVAQHDENWRLRASLCDAEQRAQPELLHAIRAEDFAVEALLCGHRLRALGKYGRGQPVAWLIHEFARKVLAFSKNASAIDACLHCGRVASEQRELLDPRIAILFRFV